MVFGTSSYDLIEFIESLDPFDLSTGKIVILSMFSTFFRRTITVVKQPLILMVEGPLKPIYDSDEDEEGLRDEVVIISSVTLLPPHLFEYFIVDEAHHMKNFRTAN